MTVNVLLDEEYGYREWLWKTGMTAEQLTEWWTSLRSVSAFFFDPSQGGMPGEMLQIIEDTTDLNAEVARVRADESLSTEEQDAAIAKAYQTMPYKMVIKDTGEPMPDAKGWWRGHLHMDDDSWLETSEGVMLRHAGYSEEE